MQECYRHPGRETGVSCSSCGRAICTDCMTPTQVGMRCPECAGQRTKVRTAASLRVEPRVTYVLLALNLIAFFGSMAAAGGGLVGGGTSAPTLLDRGALFGPAVHEGEWWRLVTGGFLHSGLLHVAFNMYLLYMLGQMLEPALGHLRFGALYGAALLAGSFGALLVSPGAVTVGASGAVFGLMGAALLEMRRRGIDPMQSGLGMLLALNLVITFLPGFNISIGGHLGGLAGGILAGLALSAGGARRSRLLGIAGCVLVGAAAAVGAVVAAGTPSLY